MRLVIALPISSKTVMMHTLRVSYRLQRPISNILQCTCPISHNTPFRTEMCTFLLWMVCYGIWDKCIVRFVRLIYWVMCAENCALKLIQKFYTRFLSYFTLPISIFRLISPKNKMVVILQMIILTAFSVTTSPEMSQNNILETENMLCNIL